MYKKSKKTLFVLAAAFVLTSAMEGCSGGGSNSSSGPSPSESTPAASQSAEPVTLRFWGGVPPESGYQKMCENFGQEFAAQGLSVEYERYVNDETGNMKLDTALMAGSDIDVFMTYGQSPLVKRKEGGMTQDLTAFLEKDGYRIEEMFGDFASTTYIDGVCYALPTTLTQNNLLINKDLFDEAGIPIPTSWTLDELRETAKKLTKGEGENKVYGMFWNTGAIMGDVTPVKLALGGDYFYKDGGNETNFDHPFFEKTVSTIYTMMNEDGSSPTHVDSITQKLTIEGMFLNGKTAITVGTWAIRNVKNREEYPHDFVTAAAPYPTIEGEGNYSNGEFGDLLCMNSKSKHQDEAWTFMKWYAEKGILPIVGGGRTPSCVKLNEAEVTAEFVKGFEDLLDTDSIARVMITPKEKYPSQTVLNKLPELTKILNEELEAVYTGDKTAKDAMASAKSRGDEMLKS